MKKKPGDMPSATLTNKILFLDVYGDINLVGHVIKSLKAVRAFMEDLII